MNTLSCWWPTRYLLLLAHDTAPSVGLGKLLAHRLRISGAGRSGLEYRRRSDLLRLRWRAIRDGGSPHRYLFDTLIDNSQLVPLALAQAEPLRALVCLSRPESALCDLLSDAAVYGTAAPQQAAERYCERTDWLAAIGPNLGPRALVFPEEMIREQPATLLGAIALHAEVDALAVAESGASAADSLSLPAPAPLLGAQLEAAVGMPLANQCRAAYDRARRELARWCPTLNLIELGTDSPARALVIKLGLGQDLEDTVPERRSLRCH